MTRCVLCRRRIWPWQRIGWLNVLEGKNWHARCMRTALFGSPDGDGHVSVRDIQRVLDEAQR